MTIDHRFLDLADLTRKTSKRLIGIASDITSGYATHTLSTMLDGPPANGTEILFRDQSGDITLASSIDFTTNGLMVYAESAQAVLDTNTYTVTFSGDNIIANIFVTDPSNVITTGNGCRVRINAGERETSTYTSGTKEGPPNLLRKFVLNENITLNFPIKIIDDSGAKIEVPSFPTVVGDNPISGTFGVVSGYLQSLYDPDNNKIFNTCYNPTTSEQVDAVVGTVSGNTVTWGTPIRYSTAARYIVTCYDTLNNKIIEIHSGGSTDSYANVIEISGNTFTRGPENNWATGVCLYSSCCFDSNSNKAVLIYQRASDMWARVFTVSGNTITAGPEVSFETDDANYTSCCFDSNTNKVVVAYMNLFGDNTPNVKIGTVSGDSITFGAKTVMDTTGRSEHVGCAFDTTSNKVVLTWSTLAQDAYAVVGTVSGNTITLGQKVLYSDGILSAKVHVSIDSVNDIVYLSWVDTVAPQSIYVTTAKIVGNTLVLSGVDHIPDNVDDSITALSPIVYDVSNDVSVLSWRVDNTPDEGHSQILDLESYTSIQYDSTVGISKETGTTGQIKPIGLIGDIIDTFSGQTPGAIAYIQTDGSISEVVTQFPIGRFISDTELLITKDF